ncbi:MAG TPA: hypothetical protein VMT35_01105, partial [Ignavibacteriaceae bacterium]|nr:hypothetical protein [Ignavibacteriaceae bacterium]
MKKYIIPIFILSIIHYGCSNSVVIKPKYERDVFKKNIIADSTNKKVTKVLDLRDTKATLAGSAQVGLFNKLVPYYIEDTVSLFVQKAI